MRDFGGFVYLDVQKTGSRFIGEVLVRFANVRQVDYVKHACVRPGRPLSRLHFISCRDPLDQYLSLYSFGCQGRGRFAERLDGAGLGSVYDGTSSGFAEWVRAVLDPTRAGQFSDAHAKVSSVIGLQTFRYLWLALDKRRQLLACRTRQEVAALHDAHNIAQVVIRFEGLRESLVSLIEGPLAAFIKDIPAAVDYVRSAPPLNTSVRIDRDPAFVVDNATLAIIEEREWFFFEKLGYPRYGSSAARDPRHGTHSAAVA